MESDKIPCAEAAEAEHAASSVWLPAIVARVASFLPPQFVTFKLRFVDKATSELFSDVNTVQLSQPAPRGAFAEHWLAPGACRSLTLQQRQQLVCLVAASGNVANLKVALQAADCVPTDDALEAATAAGALKCCKYLTARLQMCKASRLRILCVAAKGGHRAVCKWRLARGAKRSWWAVTAAYSGGHTELAELLRPEAEESCCINEQARVLADTAEGCSLDVLNGLWAEWGQQLLASGPTYRFSMVLSAAVGSPTPDWEAKAEFLLAQGFALGPYSAFTAEDTLHLPPNTALQRLEWMRLRGWAPAEQS